MKASSRRERGKLDRRRFLKKTGAAAVGVLGFPYVVSPSALGNAGTVAPGNRVVLGCVGVGSQGSGVMANFLNSVPRAAV